LLLLLLLLVPLLLLLLLSMMAVMVVQLLLSVLHVLLLLLQLHQAALQGVLFRQQATSLLTTLLTRVAIELVLLRYSQLHIPAPRPPCQP
jgi:hypothetical protein